MSQRAAHAASDPRQRLLELTRDRGTSLASLSELLGRNASYLQQFIKKGSPRKLEEGDRRTLAQFFGISEAELREDGIETKEKSYIRAEGPSDWVAIPRLDIGASAGPGAFPISESVADTLRFSRRWLGEQGLGDAQLSVITVEGDSMEPLLNDGDEILVDTRARPFRDGIHVVRLGETLMVKRVARTGTGTFTLLSQNLAYLPIEVDAGECEIVGRVVWKGGRI
ncbi:MAG: LexA family transcriptional regulator [Erythrobacter sp.]|jgi:phage repressor protein C with HTH and peptisase S24 domain|nr:LexA family transcriptional regulator [Erythrobacter sp.]